MAIAPSRVVWTYAELQAWAEQAVPDERSRYEILGGELVVTPAPNLDHQGAAAVLLAILLEYVYRLGLGKVYGAPTDVVLGPSDVVQPDVLYVARERLQILRESHIAGPPDLVIEVLSPSTARRDRGAKAEIYAQYGVPNYWLIDPAERRAEAYVLIGKEYQLNASGEGDAPFAAAPFPELAIPLGRLWE